MVKYIIVNECGTRCFGSKRFKSYEDGWNFLYDTFPVENGDDKEDILDQYFVIRESEPHQEFIGGLYIQFQHG